MGPESLGAFGTVIVAPITTIWDATGTKGDVQNHVGIVANGLLTNKLDRDRGTLSCCRRECVIENSVGKEAFQVGVVEPVVRVSEHGASVVKVEKGLGRHGCWKDTTLTGRWKGRGRQEGDERCRQRRGGNMGAV